MHCHHGWTVADKQPTSLAVDTCQSAEVDHSVLSTGQLWSSVFCCCGHVDLESAARQSSWFRYESRHFQAL